MIRLRLLVAVFALALASGFASETVLAQDTSAADEAYAEMESMLGLVPTFLKAFPKVGIAAAWGEMKAVQMNPNTALSGKDKELIGLAVAAQIPCEYCVYFHTAAARANGATDEEIQEAIAMAAITRHWSTVPNGSQIDYAAFKKEADQMLAHAAKTSGGDAGKK
jgi:AhpD family alkylhydroperoxidase